MENINNILTFGTSLLSTIKLDPFLEPGPCGQLQRLMVASDTQFICIQM